MKRAVTFGVDPVKKSLKPLTPVEKALTPVEKALILAKNKRKKKNVKAKAILNEQLKRVEELQEPEPRLTNIPIEAFDLSQPVYNKESFTAYIQPRHIFPWFKDAIKSYTNPLNRKIVDDFYRKNSWGQPSYPNNTVIDKDPLLLTTIFMPIPENIKRFGVEIEGIGDKIPETQTSGDKKYLFYMLSKFVLFDRRYINYNVYTKPAVVAAADAAWEFQYSLVAYTSSSQVGSWRLCLTEAGNRLNKFDDYVQSTTLHYKICKKMAELYYEPDLLWADELENNLASGAEPAAEVRARNVARNTYQNNNGVAMPYDPFVMEGGTHQYFAYPKIYKKTDPNLIMTNIILNRGIPDMFNFWTEAIGKCGDDIFFEDGILKNVTIFSNLLDQNYQPISHTFLYDDRMVYVTHSNKKLFRSTAKVFLIRSRKRDGADPLLPDDADPLLPEYIDQICVFYTMKQWASNQWKNEGINYASTEKPVIFDRLSDLDVAGSYVQSMPLPYYIVNQLGLYLFYYKCGFYVCKPLEYSTQCRVLEYIRANGNPTLIPIEIIESYKFVGFRNSANYPFFCPELYNYSDAAIEAISHYYEHNIDIQQAVIRTMPINNDADLATEVALEVATGVAGVAAVPIPAGGVPRVLTIDYPFLERELRDAVRLDPVRRLTGNDLVSIPGQTRTLSKSGKQKYLMKYIGNPNRDIANDSNIGQPEITASPSLNKAYTFLRDAVHVAVDRLRRVMSFDQKDVPTARAAGVPVIPISGGYYRKRKTAKNQYKKRKTKKTKKNQYKKRKTKKGRSRT
jgi:hypothetical protein